MMPDALAALREVKAALDQAGIEFLVVGSLASSLHGLPRATQDADLIVMMSLQQVTELGNALGSSFYFPEAGAYDAIRLGKSFNAIHQETLYKVDFFAVRPTPFNRVQFERGQSVEIDLEESLSLPFQSAEDTILSKLDWFRQGHEVSERQWQDILGIIRAQGDVLDLDYLRRWAANLGVDDLLQRALDEQWPRADDPGDNL